jgi:hypothetical protein
LGLNEFAQQFFHCTTIIQSADIKEKTEIFIAD